MHRLSPALTLQGAVAHCDMPVETGPTLYLPYSQQYEPGYLAFHLPEFTEYFQENYTQLPLEKGDAAFFNPALFHGAGTNVSTDVRRMANLLQVSSPFGRAMETVDRVAMCRALFPVLLAKKAAGASELDLDNVIAASAEGYAFPTNLDRDQPIDGLAPQTQADLVRQAVAEEWTPEAFDSALDAQAARTRPHATAESREMPTDLLATCWTHAGDALPVAGRQLSPLDLRARAEAVAAAGFTGIGFTIDDLEAAQATYDLPEVRRICDDLGLVHLEVELLENWWTTGARRRESDRTRSVAADAPPRPSGRGRSRSDPTSRPSTVPSRPWPTSTTGRPSCTASPRRPPTPGPGWRWSRCRSPTSPTSGWPPSSSTPPTTPQPGWWWTSGTWSADPPRWPTSPRSPATRCSSSSSTTPRDRSPPTCSTTPSTTGCCAARERSTSRASSTLCNRSASPDPGGRDPLRRAPPTAAAGSAGRRSPHDDGDVRQT